MIILHRPLAPPQFTSDPIHPITKKLKAACTQLIVFSEAIQIIKGDRRDLLICSGSVAQSRSSFPGLSRKRLLCSSVQGLSCVVYSTVLLPCLVLRISGPVAHTTDRRSYYKPPVPCPMSLVTFFSSSVIPRNSGCSASGLLLTCQIFVGTIYVCRLPLSSGARLDLPRGMDMS
jgi:hypothetical protein